MLGGESTERDVGGAETARGRPATARAQLGGAAMSDLLGAPASGSLTARPSTAPGGAVQDWTHPRQITRESALFQLLFQSLANS